MKYKFIFIISNDFGAYENNILIYNSLKKNTKFKTFHIVLRHQHILKRDKNTIFLNNHNSNKYFNFVINKHIQFILFSSNLVNHPFENHLLKYSVAKKINCGFIQDYWGSFGDFKKNIPNNIFLFDELSKNISLKKNSKSNLIISGLPKFSKNKLIKKDKKYEKTIFIIGQPLNLPGIKYNLDILLTKLENYNNYDIIYKPHPSDNNHISFLKKYPFVNIIKTKNYQKLFVNCKVTITFFSSLGLEHSFIQSNLNFQISSLYYCLIGRDINKFIFKTTNNSSFPPETLGIGNVIKSSRRIDDILSNKKNKSNNNYLLNSKKIFNLGMKPITTIKKHILL